MYLNKTVFKQKSFNSYFLVYIIVINLHLGYLLEQVK